MPRDQAQQPLVEEQDPRRLPEHGLLRQSRLRRRGRLADVLLAPCVTAHAPPGCAPRRPSAGAVDLRPVPQPTRCERAPQRGAVRDVAERGHHACAVPLRAPLSAAARAGPSLQQDQAAVLLLVRPRRARAGVRREPRPRGRAAHLHDDRAASAARREQGDPRDALLPRRSCRGDRVRRARDGSDPRDDRCHPRQHEEPVQPRRAVRARGGLDVQGVRARVRDRARDRSRQHVLPVGAVHLRLEQVVRRRLRGREAVDGADVRPQLHRLDVDHPCHAALRQHGLCAADARRGSRLRLADGAPARGASDAEAGGVDRSRAALGLAARHGRRVRDVRLGRHLRAADGDHEGRPARWEGGQDGRLGEARHQARALGRRRLGGDAGARTERALRHRRRLG